MGLDMYLSRKTYVKNWDHMKPEERHKITVKKGGKTRKDILPERISYVIEEVAYWRKANQIHKWFIDTCNEGDDDNCSEIYVSREQLQELVRLCKQVLDSVETVDGKIHNGTSFTFENGEMQRHEHYEEGKVVAQPGLAAQLLPTQEGFFFGSTDYDEYYLQDLRDTIKMLEPVINEESEGDFYYYASW